VEPHGEQFFDHRLFEHRGLSLVEAPRHGCCRAAVVTAINEAPRGGTVSSEFFRIDFTL